MVSVPTKFLTFVGAENVPTLSSSQEEADTRMLLHAQYAESHGATNITIVSDDTDVLVLALAAGDKLDCQMYVMRGTAQNRRVIDVNHLRRAIGPKICLALRGIHAFTGCDFTSAFSGQGKVKPFKLMRKEKRYQVRQFAM